MNYELPLKIRMYGLIFLLLTALVAFNCQAAAPPESLKFLDGYFNKDPNAALTVVQGKPLKEYSLEEYRGLTLTYTPANAMKIEEAVKADLLLAEDKEVAYRQGNLYYTFLTLPKAGDGTRRYIFYLNQTLAKGNKIILIYMRGKASADKIRKLIKK